MLLRKAKFKKDRSLMQNTWGLKKSPFNKRKYKPGIHKNRNLFSSLYGNLLVQRQRLRNFYFNLKSQQLKNIIHKNIKFKNYKELIIKHLESRLDTLLFRAGFVVTFSMARQMINHRKILVNDQVITSPSYMLKSGDKISFKPNMSEIIKDNIFKIGRRTPNYVIIAKDNCSLTFDAANLPKTENDLIHAYPLSIDDVIRSYGI